MHELALDFTYFFVKGLAAILVLFIAAIVLYMLARVVTMGVLASWRAHNKPAHKGD